MSNILILKLDWSLWLRHYLNCLKSIAFPSDFYFLCQ
uniref:Uncharacterized protein n=1 Tax=Rhizophora mucronata TaxID=61149 RepID=A0A2P2QEX2_RHIMU